MAIYFITNGLHRMGGTERVIIQLAKMIGDVTLLVPGKMDVAFSDCENLKIKSLEVGDFPVFGKLYKLKHRFDYFNSLMRNIILCEEDIIFSFSFDLNLINIVFSSRFGCKAVICEHIEYNYHKGIRNKIRKYFYSKKNVKLVCLTETDKLKFEKDGINVTVIPNFIFPISASYQSDSKKILAVGRLEYQKNFEFLIRAFQASEVYVNGWSLDIVGEGAEYDMLNQIVSSSNLSNYVKIHKFTKNLDEFYKSAGLLCMTSRFEALPMVLLESMNFKLPVLVTDFPTGAREILGVRNPQIVLDYEIDSYAIKLREICLDIETRKTYSFNNSNLIQYYYPERIKKLWSILLMSE
ncbi:glycosyltransferase [Acinetobacter ursingii]|uniref:glycosyltransferase n=1 Tax=Acinetobacter ursingii TaxID=108980 RepID=UPI0005C88519|nr:glycosyltransferase [Acinetobacter ursingii]